MLDAKEVIERYVPHSRDMMLIDRVLEYGPEFVVTEIDVGPHLPCFSDGQVPAYLGLEVMAQSIAVWSGIARNSPGRRQPIGFLLGTRKYECEVSCFEAGTTLQVHASELLQNEGLGSFACILGKAVDGQMQGILAKANVNVFSVEID